jgi:hypothetical protein
LTCRGIKPEIIATTFTIFTFKKRQQSYYRKKSCIPSELLTAICAIKLSVYKKKENKITSFLTLFLDISLSTSNVSGNVVLASLGLSVGISSPN